MVEFHREGSAPAACAAGFFIFMIALIALIALIAFITLTALIALIVLIATIFSSSSVFQWAVLQSRPGGWALVQNRTEKDLTGE